MRSARRWCVGKDPSAVKDVIHDGILKVLTSEPELPNEHRTAWPTLLVTIRNVAQNRSRAEKLRRTELLAHVHPSAEVSERSWSSGVDDRGGGRVPGCTPDAVRKLEAKTLAGARERSLNLMELVGGQEKLETSEGRARTARARRFCRGSWTRSGRGPVRGSGCHGGGLVLSTLLTSLAATAVAGPISAAQAATDAAGDTTVFTVGPPHNPGVASLVPEVTVGGIDGPAEEALSGIALLVARADGSIIVLDGRVRWPSIPPILKEFDRRGEYVRTLGGRGQGPGEYELVTGMALHPDGRLLVLDPTQRRITAYADTGAVADTWRLPIPAHHLPNGVYGWESLRVDTAGIVHVYFGALGFGPGGERDSNLDRSGFVRLGPDGEVVDRWLAPDLPDVVATTVTITGTSGTAEREIPYSPRTVWDLSPHGHFVTARTDRYAIDVRRPGAREAWSPGDPVVSIRREVPPVPVPDAERVARRRDFVETWIGDQGHGPIPPVPDSKPPIRWLEVASDGRIWVQVSAPSERFEPMEMGDVPWREPDLFDVFEDDGTYVGRVHVPWGVRLLHRRGDRVWGVIENDLGVPFVTRYRIGWGEG